MSVLYRTWVCTVLCRTGVCTLPYRTRVCTVPFRKRVRTVPYRKRVCTVPYRSVYRTVRTGVCTVLYCTGVYTVPYIYYGSHHYTTWTPEGNRNRKFRYGQIWFLVMLPILLLHLYSSFPTSTTSLQTFSSCRPAWLWMDRKIFLTATTSLLP